MGPLPGQEEVMEVKVIMPFGMGGQKYNQGDTIDLNPEKVDELKHQGLIEVKLMDKPTKDKMVKLPMKTKSKRRKR
jgi:hypothetical protein